MRSKIKWTLVGLAAATATSVGLTAGPAQAAQSFSALTPPTHTPPPTNPRPPTHPRPPTNPRPPENPRPPTHPRPPENPRPPHIPPTHPRPPYPQPRPPQPRPPHPQPPRPSNGTVCGDWVEAPGTDLSVASCVVRDGDSTYGYLQVDNTSSYDSFYVDSIQVRVAGGGYTTCSVRQWIEAGDSTSCATQWETNSRRTSADGAAYIYDGRQYQWVRAYSDDI